MSKVIRFTETILRDAQQSQIATRMSTEDMLPILKTLDEAGFYALEMWGGATFDACLRFLNEDPWERLRKIRAEVKHTKLQMLLRGQNLLGYKNYADDVVEKFVQKSVENGIDIIRVFDALNDVRNLETCIRVTKKAGGHCQAPGHPHQPEGIRGARGGFGGPGGRRHGGSAPSGEQSPGGHPR